MPNILSLTDVVNRHLGLPAVIDCSGPSSNNNRERVDQLHSAQKLIKFVCNEWYNFPHATKPNYWVVSNPILTVTSQLGLLNKHKVPFLWASSLDGTSREFVDRKLEVDCLAYRQGGIAGDGADFRRGRPWAAFHREGEEMQVTIQKFLQTLAKHDQHYTTGVTVAYHMIAFALIMGCNPIYLNGMDLNYDEPGELNGYAQTRKGVVLPRPGSTTWKLQTEGILSDLKILNDTAVAMGRQIINLNKKAWFDEFEKGDLYA